MQHSISLEHKKQLDEIRKALTTIGARESNFVKVELLFYEAMTVARAYGDDVNENGFLAALKQLQANQYRDTKALFNKSSQRERVIRRFISSLKTVLSAGMKNSFLQPELT